MTGAEILALLNTEVNKDDFEYMEGDPRMKELFGFVKQVSQEGGEGEGEDYSVVNHFVSHDVYVELCGFYSSYNGTDWDGNEYKLVRPMQKEITVYVNAPKEAEG